MNQNKKITREIKGWCIVCIKHPVTGSSYVADGYSTSKTGAIKKFTNNTTRSWEYWRKNFNFRAVKCTEIIIASI